MQLPEKEWFNLNEIAEKWNCSVEELLHFSELGRLQICFRFDHYQKKFMELNHQLSVTCVHELITDDFNWKSKSRPYVIDISSDDECDMLDRIFALCDRDLVDILRYGSGRITGGLWGEAFFSFTSTGALQKGLIIPPVLDKSDLVITRKEKEYFEGWIKEEKGAKQKATRTKNSSTIRTKNPSTIIIEYYLSNNSGGDTDTFFKWANENVEISLNKAEITEVKWGVSITFVNSAGRQQTLNRKSIASSLSRNRKK
jgi:hypothetical protein